MCAISATVQHFICSGDRGRPCAFQRGRHDPKGSGIPRRGGWGGGGDTVRTRAEGGLGNVLCRRRRRRIEIPRRVGENDDHYRGSVWGIWPDSVGEEDRDSLDAGAGETTEERGIAATTTCHRSSGAKVRPDHPVPILGRPCQRRWRTHARDQPPEQSRVGMHQEVLPGALRPAESTVETQGSTVESGGDGGPTIRVHDVGPPPRTLPVTNEDTPPTTLASYRVPPRARHLPTAFVRSGP